MALHPIVARHSSLQSNEVPWLTKGPVPTVEQSVRVKARPFPELHVTAGLAVGEAVGATDGMGRIANDCPPIASVLGVGKLRPKKHWKKSTSPLGYHVNAVQVPLLGKPLVGDDWHTCWAIAIEGTLKKCSYAH